MRFSNILVAITNKPCHHSTTPTTAPAPSPKMNPPPAPIPRVPSPTGPALSPRANLPQAPHPSVNKPHRQQPSKSYSPLELHKIFHPSNQHRATTQYTTLLRQVVAAAFEAELGAAFINTQKTVPMQQALENMGHPQPPTTLKTNNSTAHGILTSIVKQKQSNTFNTKFYWLKDCIRHKHFNVYWKPGHQNKANNVTKHYPQKHHKIRHSKNLMNLIHTVKLMQGCVDPVPAQLPNNGHGTDSRHRIQEQTVPIHEFDHFPRQNNVLIS
jgi:hypothetical protein